MPKATHHEPKGRNIQTTLWRNKFSRIKLLVSSNVGVDGVVLPNPNCAKKNASLEGNEDEAINSVLKPADVFV